MLKKSEQKKLNNLLDTYFFNRDRVSFDVSLLRETNHMKNDYYSLNESFTSEFQKTLCKHIMKFSSEKFDTDENIKKFIDGTDGNFADFENMTNTIIIINILRKKLDSESNRNSPEFKVVLNLLFGLENLQKFTYKNSKYFIDGYRLKNQAAIHIYRTICANMLMPLSFLMIMGEDYFVTNEKDISALSSHVKQLNEFDSNLKSFIDSLEKNFSYVAREKNIAINEAAPLVGLLSIIGGTGTAILGFIAILLAGRYSVYIFYSLRRRLSNYLDYLRNFTESHLAFNEKNLNTNKKEKYLKVIKLLKKSSNILNFEFSKEVKKVESDIKMDESKIYKAARNDSGNTDNTDNNSNLANSDYRSSGSLI